MENPPTPPEGRVPRPVPRRGEVLGGPRSFVSTRCGFLRRSVGPLGLVWGGSLVPFRDVPSGVRASLDGPWGCRGVLGCPFGLSLCFICFIVMIHFFNLFNFRIN